MQTNLSPVFLKTSYGPIAESILRSCVHCGFCNATCPTYQELGNELDGPRGRIYLMKQVLEGQEVTAKTQTHLDSCLTCRSCETTCPSGVQYGKLVDIGRMIVEEKVPRSPIAQLKRKLLRLVVPYPKRFAFFVGLGQLFKLFMPASLAHHLPIKQEIINYIPVGKHPRKMLAFSGCAQSVATPNTNIATTKVLDVLGIQLVTPIGEGCCGALSHHLSQEEEAKVFMRRNIDAWWPHIQAGAEAIVSTASGCGVHMKDYGYLLKDDPAYADKALKVSALCKDIGEILLAENVAEKLKHRANTESKLAMHVPCTLQHGQKLAGLPEKVLTSLGFNLCEVKDSHLCCGSAGSYAVLQPVLSQKLLANKITALEAGQPHRIATANIGCQMHLGGATSKPVQHWIELVAELV